ncbi:hypothetical protein EV714DRAFT_271292 [Schizophyllum commune]
MSSPLDFLKEFFEGNIDFVGQHYAEEAARSILIAGTVLSFFAGYFSQSMKVTFSALGSFVVLAAIVRALPTSFILVLTTISFATSSTSVQNGMHSPITDSFGGLMHDAPPPDCLATLKPQHACSSICPPVRQLVIPPWPMYRSNPVSWLPPVDTSASTKKKA